MSSSVYPRLVTIFDSVDELGDGTYVGGTLFLTEELARGARLLGETKESVWPFAMSG